MRPPYYFTHDQLQELNILALSGKLGSGKSTLARFLIQTYGFAPEAFARHLKVAGVAFEGLPFNEVFGPSEAKSTRTRDRMQKMGTEEGRDVYGDDIWLKTTEANLYLAYDAGVRNVILTDCRFPNEAEFISALGGKVYRIKGRGGSPNPETAAHRSETSLDTYTGFHRFINNSPEYEPWALDRLAEAVETDFGVGVGHRQQHLTHTL